MGFKPTHVSHKQVEAYPLLRLEKRGDGRLIAIVRLGAYEGPIEVPPNITARGEPQPGSMLVRYPPTEHEPDGYLAFSPRDAFDAGYTPLPIADVAQDLRRSVPEMFAAFRAELMSLGTSREMSVALTNLDTARLWAGEHKGA